MNTQEANEIVDYTKISGGCRIKNDIFLQTGENLAEQQKDWNDGDQCKDKDFTIYKYWVVFCGGDDPIGVDTPEELMKIFPEGT